MLTEKRRNKKKYQLVVVCIIYGYKKDMPRGQRYQIGLALSVALWAAVIFMSKQVAAASALQWTEPSQDSKSCRSWSGVIFLVDNGAESVNEEVVVISKKINFSSQKKVSVRSKGIGKPGPIRSKVKMVDGGRVCASKNDHPSKSKKNPKGHVDSECCLDPDETPNSLCYYPQAKYAKYIQKFLSSQKAK